MAEITYARLDQALRSLDFTVRDTDDRLRVYKHAASGAILVFPIFDDGDTVLPRHLAAVRLTLDGFGFPDPLDLAAKWPRAI
jgi:hypothetical protein